MCPNSGVDQCFVPLVPRWFCLSWLDKLKGRVTDGIVTIDSVVVKPKHRRQGHLSRLILYWTTQASAVTEVQVPNCSNWAFWKRFATQGSITFVDGERCPWLTISKTHQRQIHSSLEADMQTSGAPKSSVTGRYHLEIDRPCQEPVLSCHNSKQTFPAKHLATQVFHDRQMTEADCGKSDLFDVCL